MMAESRGEDTRASSVDDIYREFRRRLENGEAIDFESLVSRYPEHENALRLLHLAHDEDVQDDGDPEAMHALLRDGLAVGSAIHGRSVGAASFGVEGEIPSASGGRRYTVRRQIARGGMGRILEVWDEL